MEPQPVVVPPFALALAAVVGPIEFLTTSLPELLRTPARTPCRGRRSARAMQRRAPSIFFVYILTL
jgi:hypothetical protein